MIISKIIITIICSINFKTGFVKGQAVSVAVSSVNGFSSSSSSSSSAGFGLSPLLNSLYQPIRGVLDELSTIQQHLLPGRVITNTPNFYNQQQYYQPQFPGNDNIQSFNRPHVNINNPHYQHLGQWPQGDRNIYENFHTNNNNFAGNPGFNQNFGINGVNTQGSRRTPKPNRHHHNHSWHVQTPNSNYNQTPLNNMQTNGLIRGPDDLVSEIVKDPLKVKNKPDSLISEPIENPLLKPNYPQKPLENTLTKSQTPSTTPWPQRQEDLISQAVADPLKTNNFQDSLISEIVDDPLNIKNSRDSLTNQPVTESPNKNFYTKPATTAAPIGKPKPGTIIHPDSPYYIADDLNDPSLSIDVRIN